MYRYTGDGVEPWNVLAAAMASEGMHAPERLRGSLMRKAYCARPPRAIVVWDQDRIIHHGALLKTNQEDWMEVAQLWLAPERRHNGYLPHLLTSVLALRPGTKRFLITKDERVAAVSAAQGFVEADERTQVESVSLQEWAKQLGILHRLPPHVLGKADSEPLRRRLFIRA